MQKNKKNKEEYVFFLMFYWVENVFCLFCFFTILKKILIFRNKKSETFLKIVGAVTFNIFSGKFLLVKLNCFSGFRLVTWIRHMDQQKASGFKNDLCELCFIQSYKIDDAPFCQTLWLHL